MSTRKDGASHLINNQETKFYQNMATTSNQNLFLDFVYPETREQVIHVESKMDDLLAYSMKILIPQDDVLNKEVKFTEIKLSSHADDPNDAAQLGGLTGTGAGLRKVDNTLFVYTGVLSPIGGVEEITVSVTDAESLSLKSGDIIDVKVDQAVPEEQVDDVAGPKRICRAVARIQL